MRIALTLAERGVGITGTNPSVGCLIVNNGRILSRGYTQLGGRPHAEAMALQAGGPDVSDATIYVTLEPCAHDSERGPACTDLLISAKPARIVIAMQDPDPRTCGKGIEKLTAAGIDVEIGCLEQAARKSMAGFCSRIEKGRPFVTLKLATSLDGKIALDNGESQWITGAAARAHTHLQRARHDAILIGGGTLRKDNPSLNVRLPGLEKRNPEKYALTSQDVPQDWQQIRSPEEITGMEYNSLMIEGGAETASAFLKADLIDRLLLYRAPILMGAGKACLGDIGLSNLADAHERWQLLDSRDFDPDRKELYERCEPA